MIRIERQHFGKQRGILMLIPNQSIYLFWINSIYWFLIGDSCISCQYLILFCNTRMNIDLISLSNNNKIFCEEKNEKNDSQNRCCRRDEVMVIRNITQYCEIKIVSTHITQFHIFFSIPYYFLWFKKAKDQSNNRWAVIMVWVRFE